MSWPMTWQCRLLVGVVLLIMTCAMYGCDGAGGIGVGAPLGGARWGGGGSNPGVIVGGPVYR
jgi:hypothetical protein